MKVYPCTAAERGYPTRGAHDILGGHCRPSKPRYQQFTSHVLRHPFGTDLVRKDHALVVFAGLQGHEAGRTWGPGLQRQATYRR